jgi:excisionase family DNA binding protein
MDEGFASFSVLSKKLKIMPTDQTPELPVGGNSFTDEIKSIQYSLKKIESALETILELPRHPGNTSTAENLASGKQLSAKEVAERFRVRTWTVYQWARTGRLPCIRLGKRSLHFLESDLEFCTETDRLKSSLRRMSYRLALASIFLKKSE